MYKYIRSERDINSIYVDISDEFRSFNFIYVPLILRDRSAARHTKSQTLYGWLSGRGFDLRHLSSCPIEFVTAKFVTRRVPNTKVKRYMKGDISTLVASLRPSLWYLHAVAVVMYRDALWGLRDVYSLRYRVASFSPSSWYLNHWVCGV